MLILQDKINKYGLRTFTAMVFQNASGCAKLETDIPATFLLDYQAVKNMGKLLVTMTEMVPFKPNISKLSRQIGLARESLIQYLYYLHHADILQLLYSSKKGVSKLNKPEKIYLNNPGIIYALSDNQPEIGNIRETFFLNQLNVNYPVQYPESTDFLADNQYYFEIGGKNKTQKHIAGLPNTWIAADEIEYPAGKKIPLWLFGFLY